VNDREYLEELLKAEDGGEKLTTKQAKILQAAAEMFAEKGYAATSTSEIAKRAGVAEGTIFRHYKTKKELLVELVTPIITKFAAPFFASRLVKDVFGEEHESFEKMLETLLRNRFEFARKNRVLLKILLQEFAFHEDIRKFLADLFAERIYPKFAEAVARFQARGEIADYPAESVFRLTLTSMMGFLIARFIILPDYDWDDEAEIRRTVEFLKKGLHPGS